MKLPIKSFSALLLAFALFASPVFAGYVPPNPNGQATAANSAPVTIASDQTLPLPTGAATSAAQATGNTSLSTIVTNTGRIPANGQALGSSSVPVVLAAPNTVTATAFARPANTTAYVAGQMVANSATAGSVVPVAFNIAPANGVPVYVLKGRLLMQTSGGAAPAITRGVFRLNLYGTSPTIASGDGATYSTSMASWCGSLDGTLLYAGTDFAVAELTPYLGSFVSCTPAAGSTTIYGLTEARDAFVPTSAMTATYSLTAQ